jgi:hypothetical protein
LEWHKARIAYLEGVRADLARQLEHGKKCHKLTIRCCGKTQLSADL